MNRTQLGGQLKTFKGKAREQWGKLTDDRANIIAGKLEQLLGRIQQDYGITRAEAERQVALRFKDL